jgi:hypothetical protein
MGAGWYGLLDIIHTSEIEREYYRNRTPVACPNDGEPLRAGPEGEWFCPYDGWQYTGTPETEAPY